MGNKKYPLSPPFRHAKSVKEEGKNLRKRKEKKQKWEEIREL